MRLYMFVCIALIAAAVPFVSAQVCFEDRVLDGPVLTSGHLADLNGDGRDDLVILNSTDLRWHENDGSTPFDTPAQIIDPAGTRGWWSTQLLIRDLDGDNDLDLIIFKIQFGSFTDVLEWHENRINLGGSDQFVKHVILDDLNFGFTGIADANDDGHEDILVSYYDKEVLLWHWLRNDGNQPPSFEAMPGFALPEIPEGTFFPALLVDVDGDRLVDILGRLSVANYPLPVWLKNTGGDWTDFELQPFSSVPGEARTASELATGDIDGDGDLDVLVKGYPDSFWWCESKPTIEGGVTFVQHDIEGPDNEELYSVELYDADSDGRLDIVVIGGTLNVQDYVLWFLRNTPDGDGLPTFSTHLMRKDHSRLLSVGAVLDDDGAPGIVSYQFDYQAGRPLLHWLNFGPVFNSTSSQQYDSIASAIQSAAAGDVLVTVPENFDSECAPEHLDFLGKSLSVQCNGDILRQAGTTTTLADGASLSSNTEISIEGNLVLPTGAHCTLDAPTVTLKPVAEFTKRTLATYYDHYDPEVLREVFAVADLDGDGDQDILGQGSGYSWLSWLENDGLPVPSFSDGQLLYDPPLRYAWDAAVQDYDFDGDNDIVALEDGDVTFYINSADGFTRFTTSWDPTISHSHVLWEDLNADGLMDVILTGSEAGVGIAWNMGGAIPMAIAPPVYTPFEGSLYGLDIGDVDLDGDIDMVCNAGWFEYDAADFPDFIFHPIDLEVGENLKFVDLDGDGDLDILRHPYFTSQIAVYFENLGLGEFAEAVELWDGLEFAAATLHPIDADKDGDIDLIATGYASVPGVSTIPGVYYLERTSLSPPAFERRLVFRSRSIIPAGTFHSNVGLSSTGTHGILTFFGTNPTPPGYNYPYPRDLAWITSSISRDFDLRTPDTMLQTTGDLAIVNRTIALGPTNELVAGGVLSLDQSSELKGCGFASAALIACAGRIEPDPGTVLTLDGDYQQFYDDAATGLSAGELRITLGEGGSTSSVDVLGSANLAGALVVKAAPGFDSPVGTEFVVLTAAAPFGTERFDVASLPGLPGGKYFRIAYDLTRQGAGSVSLIVDVLDDDISVGKPNTFGVAGEPTGAALGDMNNDSLPDLIVTVPDDADPSGAPGNVVILENSGSVNGVWQGFSAGQTTIPVGKNPIGVVATDLDSANGLDLVVTNHSDDSISVLLNGGSGVTGITQTFSINDRPSAIIAVDVDQQFGPDIVVTGEGANVVTVRLNQGATDGTWDGLVTAIDFSVGARPVALEAGDTNGDGLQDLIVANFLNDSVSLLVNQGTTPAWQGFAPHFAMTTSLRPLAVDSGDLDNDKDLDIVAAGLQKGELSILLNAGDGTYGPAINISVGDSARSLALADLDGDPSMDLDVVVVVDDTNSGRLIRVLRNDQTSEAGLVFAPAQDVTTGANPIFVLVGDIDGFGRDDVVAVNQQVGGSGVRAQGIDRDLAVLLSDASACRADFTGDGSVNIGDLQLLLFYFGQATGHADADGDGFAGFKICKFCSMSLAAVSNSTAEISMGSRHHGSFD